MLNPLSFFGTSDIGPHRNTNPDAPPSAKGDYRNIFTKDHPHGKDRGKVDKRRRKKKKKRRRMAKESRRRNR